MRILLLCNKSPWPPKEGGPIAMNAMASGLINAGHEVKVLSINSNKYNIDIESVPADYRLKTGLETIYIDLSVKPLPAFFNLFTGKSFHVQRFITKEFEQTLTRILNEEKFDIIQFETLFTSPYLPLIRRLSDAKIVLRAHNIEHLIWQRITVGCRNPLKKLYLSHLTNTLRKYELKILRQVDGIAAITDTDANYFRSKAPETPVVAIPFGIPEAVINKSGLPAPSQKTPTLFHIGSMNWIPNQEGMRWFITKVWPDISKHYPELKFHVAGREMPLWLKDLNVPGIIVDGEVPDAEAYIKSHDIMIVPLFSGSGIRIKIIEGMLAGKAIITTFIGAEGIEGTDGRHFLIAEDAKGFAAAIEKCLADPGLTASLGQHAIELVRQKHNNNLLMQKISDFYDQLG